MSWIASARTDLELSVAGSIQPTAVWTYPLRGSQSGAEAPARPILLIHGFRGDHHGMDLIGHFARRHPIIVPDLPGFGATPPLAHGLRLDAYVEFIAALREAVSDEYGVPPLLAAHSFGAILAAHFTARAADTGEQPDGLVLINPITAPALEGPSRFMTRVARAYYAVSARLPERAGNAVLGSPLIVRIMSEVMATTDDPGLRRYIHDQHAKYFSTYADRDSLAQAFDVSVSHTVTEVARALTMPVLVISGGADAIAAPEPTRRFVSSLPDAHWHEFEGVGHLIHYERPEETARFIEDFADR